MKFHRSYAVLEEQNRELRTERDALLTQLDAAQKEIDTLQKQLGGKKRPTSTKPQFHTVAAKPHKAVPTPLRPSQLWNDTPHFPSPSLTDYTQLVYDDGRLIDTELRNASFMKHTISSARKTVAPSTAIDAGIIYTTKLRQDQLNLSGTSEPEAKPTLPSPTPSPTPEQEDPTGLDNNPPDNDFFTTPSSSGSSILQLPFTSQMNLLEKAYDLARQATFSHIKHHWPCDQLRYFPEHWKQVRFGLQELEDSNFGLRTCDPSKSAIVSAMYRIIPLRNHVCHPGYVRDLKSLDELLGAVEELLGLLGDGEKWAAEEVQKLRGRLQEEAKEILAEIEGREGLSRLPEAEAWPMHIQQMFERVLFEPQRWQEFPEGIVRAAREWEMRKFRVGEDDEDFEARLKEAWSRQEERLREEARRREEAWSREAVGSDDDSQTSLESGSESPITSWPSDTTSAAEMEDDTLADPNADDDWDKKREVPSMWR